MQTVQLVNVPKWGEHWDNNGKPNQTINSNKDKQKKLTTTIHKKKGPALAK